MHHSIIKQNT